MKSLFHKSAFSFISCLFLIGAFSCTESYKNDDPAPHNSAVITITSPSENYMGMPTDSVHITGTITGQQTLHGYTISIRKKTDNAEVFFKSVHDHKTAIEINQKWKAAGLEGHTDLVLEIVTTLDHDGNKASKKVNFHLMP
ncbi:hypothetical protein [Adhaeribacter soli]|uniref:DUF4625 domain-containing protein n=1 Tax=Adhaeribacter soli TaxID=2607655 RepID=A0A5N1IJU5_9BACT|nr:hypothetical protein [Adhaeribacter soli]KAA9325688.1 hypothetical protein F0P94_17290 [Adhaeribacter soli]